MTAADDDEPSDAGAAAPSGDGPAVPAPFTLRPAPRRRLRRGLLAALAAVIVLLVGLVVWGASRDPGGDSSVAGASSTGPAPPATGAPAAPGPTATPVVDRDGQTLEPAVLDGFEAGCRQLGLQAGVPFCRCARERLGGQVPRADVVEATAFFEGQAPNLPPSVRAVMSSCTSG